MEHRFLRILIFYVTEDKLFSCIFGNNVLYYSKQIIHINKMACCFVNELRRIFAAASDIYLTKSVRIILYR